MADCGKCQVGHRCCGLEEPGTFQKEFQEAALLKGSPSQNRLPVSFRGSLGGTERGVTKGTGQQSRAAQGTLCSQLKTFENAPAMR